MYLTAQRVRSPRGLAGTNVALYRHAGSELTEDVWTRPVAETLAAATRGSGRRQTAHVEVAPGGNAVESFLDIAGPDGSDIRELEAALTALRLRATAERRAQVRVGNISGEFSLNLGIDDVGASFDALARAALALYRRPQPPHWLQYDPLIVGVTHDEKGWYFQLAEESATRVRRIQGQVARVHLPYEVATSFRQMYGKVYPYVAEWVTGLSRERLLDIGGIRFMDEQTLLDEWPTRR